MSSTVTDVQKRDCTKNREIQVMKFTPEEINALRACTKNSSAIVPIFVSAAVGYGIFKISPYPARAKYAAIVGGVIGMIAGRLAIQKKCIEQVASMPNHSDLRDRLTEAGYYGYRPYRGGLQYQGGQPMDVQSEVQSSAEPSTGIVFNDYPSMNTYDTYSSINDSSDFNISEDTDLTEPINLQKGVSYDELRHKNRDEFYNKNKQWYAPRASKEPPVAKETTEQAQAPTSSNPSPRQGKTKYGDMWG